jgi:hypothetical protein
MKRRDTNPKLAALADAPAVPKEPITEQALTELHELGEKITAWVARHLDESSADCGCCGTKRFTDIRQAQASLSLRAATARVENTVDEFTRWRQAGCPAGPLPKPARR